jgi:hypothetical protein
MSSSLLNSVHERPHVLPDGIGFDMHPIPDATLAQRRML